MTNGARPCRLISHIRSSTARASRITSYMRSAWLSVNPSERCRLCPPLASTSWVLVAITLDVDREAIDGQRGLLDGFRQGRMRMDAGAAITESRLQVLCKHRSTDSLADI